MAKFFLNREGSLVFLSSGARSVLYNHDDGYWFPLFIFSIIFFCFLLLGLPPPLFLQVNRRRHHHSKEACVFRFINGNRERQLCAIRVVKCRSNWLLLIWKKKNHSIFSCQVNWGKMRTMIYLSSDCFQGNRIHTHLVVIIDR